MFRLVLHNACRPASASAAAARAALQEAIAHRTAALNAAAAARCFSAEQPLARQQQQQQQQKSQQNETKQQNAGNASSNGSVPVQKQTNGKTQRTSAPAASSTSSALSFLPPELSVFDDMHRGIFGDPFREMRREMHRVRRMLEDLSDGLVEQHDLHPGDVEASAAGAAGTSANPVAASSLSSALPLGRLSLDVTESETAYTVHADVPGVPRENIDIDVDPRHGLLTIQGKMEHAYDSNNNTSNNANSSSGNEKAESKSPGKAPRFHVRERRSMSFRRQLRLPDDVDYDAVSAKQENGVLTIVLGKVSQPEQPSRKVKIE